MENLAKGTQESSMPQGLGGWQSSLLTSPGSMQSSKGRLTAQGKFWDSEGKVDYLPWALLSEEGLP